MKHSAEDILSILDNCCNNFTFPMLDNGYVYLAATRLTLFRSTADWAMTIEVFGVSPRAGLPDTHIHTFASNIYNRKRAESYVNQQAYETYLANNPHNESTFIYPIADGRWLDGELVAEDATEALVRERPIPLPKPGQYRAHEITLQEDNRVHIFEFCRYLADTQRDHVLASPEELHINIPPTLSQILQLDEWHHPNVVDALCRPSNSTTFKQLAEVLVTGDVGAYRPQSPPNTHWRNWPEGGSL